MWLSGYTVGFEVNSAKKLSGKSAASQALSSQQEGSLVFFLDLFLRR